MYKIKRAQMIGLKSKLSRKLMELGLTAADQLNNQGFIEPNLYNKMTDIMFGIELIETILYRAE